MIKYNNKIYAWGNGPSYMYEYNNGTFTQSSLRTPGTSNPAYQVWFLNGTAQLGQNLRPRNN